MMLKPSMTEIDSTSDGTAVPTQNPREAIPILSAPVGDIWAVKRNWDIPPEDLCLFLKQVVPLWTLATSNDVCSVAEGIADACSIVREQIRKLLTMICHEAATVENAIGSRGAGFVQSVALSAVTNLIGSWMHIGLSEDQLSAECAHLLSSIGAVESDLTMTMAMGLETTLKMRARLLWEIFASLFDSLERGVMKRVIEQSIAELLEAQRDSDVETNVLMCLAPIMALTWSESERSRRISTNIIHLIAAR